MKVELIARTFTTLSDEIHEQFSVSVSPGDSLAEFAGRACYESWDKPNPATATNEGYLANIIKQQHFSVLEHASCTFYITGVSRSLTHELVRHRHLSFSQRSQRYVDEYEGFIIAPPGVRDSASEMELLIDVENFARQTYLELYELCIEKGMKRKEARQIARSVLPGNWATNIVVTGNMRAWREFLIKRDNPAADLEIQELAREIKRYLKMIAPNTFGDM